MARKRITDFVKQGQRATVKVASTERKHSSRSLQCFKMVGRHKEKEGVKAAVAAVGTRGATTKPKPE